MIRATVSFVAGILFAGGLALSGMTNPGKVIAFLDVASDWDPTLALVMAGAIGSHFLVARWALRARGPILGGDFSLPTRNDVDPRLLGGAALFGLGWGATGYCPGPALVSLFGISTPAVTFVISMLVGTAMFHLKTPLQRRINARAANGTLQ